jgi:large subunit ribosomal protein L24
MPKIDPGGVLDLNKPMPISKVMLVCPNCSRPTRIAHATLENGRRVRVCRHCNQQVEVKA